MRINVVGTAGSGKSTISKRIAQKLDVPYVQLDEIFWKPNWKESYFFSKVEEIVSSDLDGNYTRTIPIKWKRVQMVVYLDRSLQNC